MVQNWRKIVSVIWSYFSKRKTFFKKQKFHCLPHTHTHTHFVSYVHKTWLYKNGDLSVLADTFDGVKPFHWLLAPNATF